MMLSVSNTNSIFQYVQAWSQHVNLPFDLSIGFRIAIANILSLYDVSRRYLGHAVEGTEEYGDETGMMGAGGSDARCFNGFNMYVLGWLSGQTKAIDTLNPGAIERYTLKSLADMGTGGYVNIKIGPLYLVYNMGKGLNAGTREYKDHILIHQAFAASLQLSPHADTILKGTLSKVGDRLEVNNFRGNDKAIVVVCAMDKVGSSGATIVVGLNRAECASSFALNSKITNVAKTNPITTYDAGTDSDTGSTNLVLHTGASLPFTAGSSMERVTPMHQLPVVLEPETDTSSLVVLQVDASLSLSSSVVTTTSAVLGSSSFDIKCDNMWKDAVAIQGFVGEQTCEWVFETQGGAYCDSAIMMAGGFGQQQEPVKKRCQVQCLDECAYAAVCRRHGDRCNTSSSIGQCCADSSCVDGICR
jgi:hypothetical protein